MWDSPVTSKQTSTGLSLIVSHGKESSKTGRLPIQGIPADMPVNI